MPTFTLIASAVPAPVVGSPVSLTTDNVPPTSMEIIQGTQGTLVSDSVNRNQTRVEYGTRFPNGGVGQGLDLSIVSGLTLRVAAGIYSFDGALWSATTEDLVLNDNQAVIWIWAKRSAPTGSPTPNPASLTFQDVNVSTTPPANAVGLIGSCKTLAGVISNLDVSGVMFCKGPDLWRYTADAGAPTDTPNSALRFYGETTKGVFFWDGTLWRPVGSSYSTLSGVVADAALTVDQTHAYTTHLNLTFSGWSIKRNLVFPNVTLERWIFNNSTQIVTVIGTSGTGVDLAVGQRSKFIFDGTNMIQTMTAF